MNAIELGRRIEKYERALRQSPNAITYATLAELYRRGELYQDAARRCQTGLEHFPDHRVLRLILIETYFALGQFEDAKRHLLFLHDLDPRKLSIILLLVEAQIALGEYEQAQQLLDEIGTPPGRYAQQADKLRAALAASGLGTHTHPELDLISEDDLVEAVDALNQAAVSEPTGVVDQAETEAVAVEPLPEEPEEETAIPQEEPLAEEPEEETAVPQAEPLPPSPEVPVATAEPPSRNKLLSTLHEVPGVVASILVNQDGQIEASSGSLSEETQLLVSDCTSLWQSFNEFVGKLGWGGEFERGLIQADTGQIRLAVMGDCMVLVQTQKKISLGLLNLRLAEIAAQL